MSFGGQLLPEQQRFFWKPSLGEFSRPQQLPGVACREQGPVGLRDIVARPQPGEDLCGKTAALGEDGFQVFHS